MFDDDQYYEFMCFDVPKVVRSPGYDHEQDEESRNGQDIKINIMDDYIWTSEWFRMSSGIYGAPGDYQKPSGGIWALFGHSGREEREA